MDRPMVKAGCLAVLIALGCVTPSAAETSVTFRSCVDKAATQRAIHECASNEARRVDAALNKVYKELLARADDRRHAEKIRASQRAWLAYRDAYVEAMYPAEDKQTEYGSMYSTDVALLIARLTELQIAALQQLQDGP